MEINEIVKDYETVRLGSESDVDRASIDYYFASEGRKDYPHISTVPQESAHKLTAFIMSQFLDPDGAWIDLGIDDRSVLEDAVKQKQIFTARLTDSNFYAEMFKVIWNGLLYKQGLLDISHHGCLSFASIDSEDVFVSKDKNLANMRVYSRTWMTGSDIRSNFVNLPDHLVMPEEGYRDHLASEMLEVVIGIIPDTSKSGYKWKKIWFLPHHPDQLLENEGGEEYYKTLPVVSYTLGSKAALSELALSPAIILEGYERDLHQYSGLVIHPPISLPLQAVQRQNYSLLPGGTVPLNAQEREPRPIQTTLPLPFTIEDRQAKERNIMRIFKVDYIEGVQQATLGQLEAHANRVAALGEIAPLVQDFMSRNINAIVDRVHSLLMSNDKEYRKVGNKTKGILMGNSTSTVLAKAEKALNASRFIQAVVPLVQVDPSSVSQLNIENVIVSLARSYNLPEALNTPEEVAAERQEMLKQQQAQQAVEQEQMQSQTALNNSKAEQGQEES